MADLKQTVFPVVSKAGIKRDGTAFDGSNWVDGQWSRFQRGKPRKIGGYRQVTTDFTGPVRGCYAHPGDSETRVFAGNSNGLQYVNITDTGGASGVTDITPAGFTASANNLWQMATIYEATTNKQRLLAVAPPNLSDIAQETAVPVWYGDTDPPITMANTGISVSGGVAVTTPYAFYFGTDGYVTWSAPGQPTNLTAVDGGGTTSGQRVAATKIVAGAPVRGGTANAPAILLWSLDAVVRGSFVGGDSIFRFDTISAQSSVLSSQAMIEYDGVFYWPGVDRFMLYNGVVRELPNDMNLNWFFDNLNIANRQKVWATKVPRFGEIWWFFPYGDSEECNAAVIYNVRENTWYDTGFAPGAQRTSGYFSQVFRYPLAFDANVNSATTYSLWQHEYGNDAVSNTNDAIQSYVESADISLPAGGPFQDQWPGLNAATYAKRFEPDFVQTGEMTLTVTGREYARSTPVTNTYTFDATTEDVPLRDEARILRFKFESNVGGGNYQMGQPLLHLAPGRQRP